MIYRASQLGGFVSANSLEITRHKSSKTNTWLVSSRFIPWTHHEFSWQGTSTSSSSSNSTVGCESIMLLLSGTVIRAPEKDKSFPNSEGFSTNRDLPGSTWASSDSSGPTILKNTTAINCRAVNCHLIHLFAEPRNFPFLDASSSWNVAMDTVDLAPGPGPLTTQPPQLPSSLRATRFLLSKKMDCVCMLYLTTYR